MNRNTSRLSTVLLGAIAVAMTAVGTVSAKSYSPRPQNGYPAGLLPECPGVLKNASISSGMLPLLQVSSQSLTKDGQVVSKTMSIMQAPKMISRDKTIDFKNKKTVLYAVGFLDSSWYMHSQAVGTAYLKRGYNVFISQTLAFFTQIYPKSVRLAPYIAKMFAEFLIKLTQQGLKAENLELVGISLGAHVVGMAAKHFYKATGKKPSRITGLDPAGPCFRTMPPDSRLDPSDGEKVDVIHTNIDGFGIAERLGHIDFYANGGEFQPGDIPYFPCLVVCSHIKAIFYWWQALEHPKKFIGVKCDSVQQARFADCYNNSETNYFGLKTDFNKPGVYYLPTKNEFPYFEGKDGLKEENEVYTSLIRSINSEDNFVL